MDNVSRINNNNSKHLLWAGHCAKYLHTVPLVNPTTVLLHLADLQRVSWGVGARSWAYLPPKLKLFPTILHLQVVASFDYFLAPPPDCGHCSRREACLQAPPLQPHHNGFFTKMIQGIVCGLFSLWCSQASEKLVFI